MLFVYFFASAPEKTLKLNSTIKKKTKTDIGCVCKTHENQEKINKRIESSEWCLGACEFLKFLKPFISSRIKTKNLLVKLYNYYVFYSFDDKAAD